MVAALIAIAVLAPLVAWVQRLRARGVITDERPLDRVIRERLTGRPAELTPLNYRRSRLRYYRLVLLIVPAITTGLFVAVAAVAQPHNATRIAMAPGFLSGLLVLAISEDRFTGVSRRQRIVSACASGFFAAMAGLVLVAAVDPHFVLSGQQ